MIGQNGCGWKSKPSARPREAAAHAGTGAGGVLWRCRELACARNNASPPGNVAGSPLTLRARGRVERPSRRFPSTRRHPLTCWDVLARWTDLSGVLPSGPAGREGGLPLQGEECFTLHLGRYGNGGGGRGLVLSTIGRIRVPWSQPMGKPDHHRLEGADGWYVAISCATCPTRLANQTGDEDRPGVGVLRHPGQRAAIFAPVTIVKRPICAAAASWRKGRAPGCKAVVLLAKAPSISPASAATCTTRRRELPLEATM
jgi:hypothetical protein